MEPTSEQPAQEQRPRAVSSAIRFLTSSVAIGLLASIIRLTQIVSGATMIVALLIVIAFFALVYLVVRKISAGRNWARILLLILVLLGTPFAVLAWPETVRRNVLSGTLNIMVTILQVAGTWLLFTRSANVWFRSHR